MNSSIQAASHHSEGKSLVVVRVPKHDEISLTTALDAGAAGIVIPHTESAQEVRDMLKEIYYRESPRASPQRGASDIDFHQQPLLVDAPLAPGPSPREFQTLPCTAMIRST
jgi:hypothetical protein